ncbi:MAG: alpha-mannosidase [Bacteroidales bacterium]|nr:alpha-mannosidase [Bacteroidales bacterium]
MKRDLYIIAIFLLLAFPVNAQDYDQLKKQIQFLELIKNSYEGYKSSECKNTISYHSQRTDITEGLLTRATNGSMEIEWQTQAIPNYFKADGAWFVWLASIDITEKEVNFDVYVDGVKRFTIPSGKKTSWSLTLADGGILKYQHFDTDQHGDSHGYMTMYAPKTWLKNGKPLSIKIIGEAAEENTWIIVFKALDIIPYLEKSIEIQLWLDVIISKNNGSYQVMLKAPAHLSGEKFYYKSGKQNGSILLKEEDGFSTANFSLTKDILNQEFTINDDNGELLYFPSLRKDTVIRKLLPEAILVNELTIDNGTIYAEGRRIYKPKTVASILALNDSKLSIGKIYLMNSSHQDIAWMDSPEKCVLERDTMLITPLIEQAKTNPDYRFDIEDALIIKEYIERHPDRKAIIQKLFDEGKISCGSSFTQPYEEMYSGEALIRQFYFGKKWLKDEFNYDANTYWNVDVPGRTLQMPQILKKSGSPFMIISRHEKGIFNWFSPDSSFVTTYSPGHYTDAYTPLHKSFYEAADYLATSAMDWNDYYSESSTENIIPVLSDWDMSPANDYSHIISQWEGISSLTDKNGVKTELSLPSFTITTAPEFMEAFVRAADTLPSILGERPALWLYIHGPAHQKALKASREGDILLTMAEKFASIDALTDKSFANYPAKRLQKAWEAKIYPDHGWGGKNGQITDDLFRRKFEFARNEAQQILENAGRSLASKIKTNSRTGTPLVVFNSLNWQRSDIVEFEINFDEGLAKSFEVTGPEGKNMPIQYQVENTYQDGSIQTAKVHFIAKDVPSIGYKTFYLITSQKYTKDKTPPSHDNEYYKIEFSDGGLNSIFDKNLEMELIDNTKFAAGEVFVLQSKGNGAGEFTSIQQPTLKGFDQTGNYAGEWKPVESGAVFSSWTKRTQLQYAVVEQKIILYHTIKKIDFEIALLNWEGVLYREFRMALPLKMEGGQVAYEVPFGLVEVGKDEMEGAAGERYNVAASELHPRGIENWIGASNDSFGVTLSSSVVVADYIDPTNHPVSSPILQPVLLASRISCHGEGNEYLQTGNHNFSFSLSSHKQGWSKGNKFGRQANEKLLTVVDPKPYKNAYLPEQQSFFSFENANDVIISTIKKAEDDKSIIVRMYDIKGENRNVDLNFTYKFKKAFITNMVEEEIKEIPTDKISVKVKLGHHAIETIKLK